ncbi:MAG: 16S rRNA (adenine(1518)-N(6)/adenine(1519)-N(6))-dimethyltransferase RsmA [Simkaniaceae bacterium]|nr:16S rRNA (adenine(1518)-N(6)/adenine(1519)-N(6))-dimethyltransferase RsmA [Simkaniaceae bacterium]
MKISDLMNFLGENDIRPKKSLSQTFLVDGNILRKIVNTANVTASDRILEIGPGPGAITELLLDAGADVIAIEMDPILGGKLKRLKGSLHVIIDDCMKVDVPSLFKDQKGKVVANIPYQLTAPILAMLLPLHDSITSLTLVMQKEVAQRIVAKPHSKNYSPISLLAQFYSEPKLAFSITPNSFYPKPKIDSATVHFSLRKPPYACIETRFFHLVRTSFQQRRKMLTGSLRNELPRDVIIDILKKHKLPQTARPENLTLEVFAELAMCPPPQSGDS